VKTLLVVATALVACGPKTGFRLTANDNDRGELTAALARRHLPEQATPVNAARQPRVFAVEVGQPKTIVAYDLASSSQLWKADADVRSRIAVGGDFIVEREGKDLVARDQQKGTIRWKVDLGGELVGATADRERAYATWHEGSKYYLAAYDGASGNRLWKQAAEGQLGAPRAQGGVLYSPFLMQWLSILDGKTGEHLARVRGLDQQISVVRVASQSAYFGSRQGVFALDARAFSGKRDASTYGEVKIPAQLERASYGPDLYDVVQDGYTAADRARVLWASEPTEGPLKFTGDGYAVHYFRYVFGFDLAGTMRWAYSNPRVELVASDHTGKAILAVSATGDLVALDPKTGGELQRGKLGTTAQVLGATFDADGWVPAAGNDAQPAETVTALVQIARDRDARFDRVKELAVASMAKLSGAEVTKQLLAILADARTPQKLKDTVVDLLVMRKDPASLPVLTQQLAVHSDFLAKTQADALGPVARAIAGLGGSKLPADQVLAALAALRGHLDAPATQVGDLTNVIGAMAAIGGGAEHAALSSHLLLYHADDDLGADPAWQKAIVTALEVHGGPGERELLRQVSEDPRTKPTLVSLIKDTLAND
jgi:outer membrane protein assembly factor BamB